MRLLFCKKRFHAVFILTCLMLFSISLVQGQEDQAQQGANLIGKSPTEWVVSDWINSKPLKLSDLKGHVVLVRFWTGPECPYCRASAPSLNELYEKYHDKGLMVIGFYHHKSSEPLIKSKVEELVQEYRFNFPIAIDYEWKTLHAWWLNQVNTGWTSVSFLMDKEGIIRVIHTGGQYVKGDADYQKIESTIEKLL